MRPFERKLSLAHLLLLIAGLAFVATQTLAAEAPIQDILPELQEDEGQVGQARIQADMAKLPISFIANAGQADASVRFMVRTGKHTIFFTTQEVVFVAGEGTKSEFTRSSVVRLRFTGANEEAGVEGEKPLPGVANFFLGDNPQQWRANVPTYAAIGLLSPEVKIHCCCLAFCDNDTFMP